MKIAATVREVRAWRAEGSGTVGLVPTMGSLHGGHLSLVERARSENRRTAATIFVNPSQFGPHEDLSRYPRDPDGDRRRLEEAGCDLVFAPSVEEVYPPGFDTFVEPGAVAAPLEGARRPGHFRGVATVVLKLFGIVAPTRAYFGRKDAQQLAVISRMVRDLDVPVEVVGCPIVRAADGLALSSRNAYLDGMERAAAPVLFRALQAAARAWAAGERSAESLRATAREVLGREPRARVDYVSVADAATFEELAVARTGALVCGAVFVGGVRLIDNVALDGELDVRAQGLGPSPLTREEPSRRDP